MPSTMVSLLVWWSNGAGVCGEILDETEAEVNGRFKVVVGERGDTICGWWEKADSPVTRDCKLLSIFFISVNKNKYKYLYRYIELTKPWVNSSNKHVP